MVRIEVAIAAGPNELVHLQIALLREHVGEQRVARDVERNAEEDVGRALVELERQFAVRDVRLEEAMARRERHRVEIARVPCGDDQIGRASCRERVYQYV